MSARQFGIFGSNFGNFGVPNVANIAVVAVENGPFLSHLQRFGY
jgi:hypothetical protein